MRTATATATRRYRNLWQNLGYGVPRVEFYETTSRVLLSYRGVDVLKRYEGWDYVLNGACIACRAGFNADSAREIIDGMLDGKLWVACTVAAHIDASGGRGLPYPA